jgi:hypothetical membrane protein
MAAYVHGILRSESRLVKADVPQRRQEQAQIDCIKHFSEIKFMPTPDKAVPQARSRRKFAAGTAPLVIRAGLLCGLVAPILWAAVIVIAGEMRPGFDHVGQYISELGEHGSTTERFMRYGGFLSTGLMHVGFAAAFYVTIVRATDRPRLTLLVAVLIALNGIGRIGAGFFACEPGCTAPESLDQRLHGLSATIAFLAIAAAALLGTIIFHRDSRLRPLTAYSLITGCVGLVFLALMSSSEATVAYVGLYERLASGVLTLWVFVTAARLNTLDFERAADDSS